MMDYLKDSLKKVIHSKYGILIVSALLLIVMMVKFASNLRSRFENVEMDYKHSQSINLCPETSAQELSQLLVTNGYIENQRDADFVADTIVSRLKRGMKFDNLYDLQKRKFGQVLASAAENEGVLMDKLAISYEKLGLTDSMPSIDELDTQLDLARTEDAGQVVVRVCEEKSRGEFLDRIGLSKKQNCANVPVRLIEYYVDSVEHSDVVGYAKTDIDGCVVFRGLDRNRGYSVLPVKKGYEYGSSQGIVLGKFDERKEKFKFVQQEHRIQMIDNTTLKQIKEDGTITIRTPEDFKSTVMWCFLGVLAIWGILVLVVRNNLDFATSLIIASGMFLTGLCVVTMFAIQSPLTEDLKGKSMALGVMGGVGIILLLQSKSIGVGRFRWKVNFVNLYQKYGYGYDWIVLVLAIILTALLVLFGNDVGGMKVNLPFPLLGTIQPSEVVKYLMVLYLASFFSRKAETIIGYSKPNISSLSDKIKKLLFVIIGLLLLLILYIVLGDMGPALVIGFTVIILYSLVKSKVDLGNLQAAERRRRKFTCDIAMLLYGIISFVVSICVGHWLPGSNTSLVFAGLWLVSWLAFGYCYRKRKQIFETAVIFNLFIFVMVFFGDVAKAPLLRNWTKVQDVAERFEERTDMCVNTWGDLDIDYDDPNYLNGKNAKPVKNTQIVNGLWAISTGGFKGQGFCNGNPNFIPAFNTDMILSSIAEQIGFIGLIMIVVFLAMMLWGIVKIGYGTGYNFAFFFCMGLAIVTSVQFFIIALGSSGMIPLTGITVPFLSYGKTSMICSLFVLGIVLSFSKNSKQDSKNSKQEVWAKIQCSVGGYDYAMNILKWTAGVVVVFIVCVWAMYSMVIREETLVRPAYVLSRKGYPTVEYNPRIAFLTKQMWAGNIYDRNGILLATSDKYKLSEQKENFEDCGLSMASIDKIAKTRAKRYYPFAENLFFMLGDQNTGLFFAYDEHHPIGYMAEAQHLSCLRDFDNLHDKNGKPTVSVELVSNEIQASSRYLNKKMCGTATLRLYDYHDLIPYLKNGVHGKKLKNHNKKVREGKFDLYLTLDAKLQTDMQNKIAKYVQKETKLNNNNLLRISVVVLDAQNGDLLTSANYPLPDYQRLQKEEEFARDRGAKGAVYSDNNKDRNWWAYTDRDLGLTYQTMPGSTAKVMSAMAGFQKLGTDAKKKKYLVTADDIIERGDAEEPYKGKRYDRHIRNDFHEKRSPLVDKVDMWLAIVESSNCYFINLVNDNDCYKELCNIYEATGIGIGNTTPYYLTNEYTKERQKIFHKKIEINQGDALKKYAKYKRDNAHTKMNAREWKWAWGQGYENYELMASPLNMARVVSAVVNGGKMPATQYVLDKGGKRFKDLRNTHTTELLSSKSAKILKEYMLDESKNQEKRQRIPVYLPNYVGGKTGTPQRYHYRERNQIDTLNDGWYVFFVEGNHCKDKHPLAVAVRMERRVGSGWAVRLTEKVVLEALEECGYIEKK